MPLHRAPRTLVALALLVIACTFFAPSRPAAAGITWCRVDPIVLIDGQLADIFVASDVKMLLSTTGPIRLQIELPPGSTGQVILADLGFGRGYDVDFLEAADLRRDEDGTQVRVSAFAPARDSSLPVRVTFAPRDLSAGLQAILSGTSATGYANEWITLTTR